MANYSHPPGGQPRKKKSQSCARAQKVGVGELATRLELALAQVPLPAEMWGRICRVVLPEEYGDGGGVASSPMRHLPHSLGRMEEYMARAERGEAICHPADPEIDDRKGILPKYDFDRPSGTLAPKRLQGEAVYYEDHDLAGEDGVALPECSDRLIREGGEARKKDEGDALVELLRKVVSQKTVENQPGQNFPQRLREARIRRKWTLRRMARLCGRSMGFLAKVERGEKIPSYATLKALACVFGGRNLSPADMLLSPWPD